MLRSCQASSPGRAGRCILTHTLQKVGKGLDREEKNPKDVLALPDYNISVINAIHQQQ